MKDEHEREWTEDKHKAARWVIHDLIKQGTLSGGLMVLLGNFNSALNHIEELERGEEFYRDNLAGQIVNLKKALSDARCWMQEAVDDLRGNVAPHEVAAMLQKHLPPKSLFAQKKPTTEEPCQSTSAPTKS